MANDRSILERQMERVQLRPFTLDGFHRRRERRQRNRRIGTAVVALAMVAAVFGGLARALTSGRGAVPADQPSSRFLGTWTSTELDFPGSSHSMTIRPAEDGALDIVLHDKSSRLCSTPSPGTGTGRLKDATTLVVPSFQVCPSGDALDVGPSTVEERAISYTLVLDVPTDRLFDNLGVAWHRGATLQNRADTMTECEMEEWGSTPPGTCSMLGGEVSFHADQPWESGNDSVDPRLFYLPGPDDASIEILANANPLPEGPCYRYPRLPASVEALAQSIRSNPDLEATVPVAERVGGIDALRLDVAPVPGASTCPNGEVPVVSTSNSGWGTMAPGQLGRLYVLNLPGGPARTLAILIIAPEAAFERAVEAAAPVVASFAFHTG
jgi:hypothetical protein